MLECFSFVLSLRFSELFNKKAIYAVQQQGERDETVTLCARWLTYQPRNAADINSMEWIFFKS